MRFSHPTVLHDNSIGIINHKKIYIFYIYVCVCVTLSSVSSQYLLIPAEFNGDAAAALDSNIFEL